MKILYYLLPLFVLFTGNQQLNAQHLNSRDLTVLKKYLDKHLVKSFTQAKAKTEDKISRNFSFTTLSDSIHTFSRGSEADPYTANVNFYYTFTVQGTSVTISKIIIKILDGSFLVEELEAVPTYDGQGRISRITMTANLLGLPLNILNYYFKFDSAGNTTSVIFESPGLFGSPSTSEGDSVEFTYGTGNRVLAYNLYSLSDNEWSFTLGVSDVTYAANGNINGLTQWLPGVDSAASAPVPFIRLRNIQWFGNQMPVNVMNPLGGDSIESDLTGIEIAVADESYKNEPIAFIQEVFTDDEWIDSTLVRGFSQQGPTFSILDSYYETGDFIYTELREYTYAGNLLQNEVVLFDLGMGSAVPLSKTEYEYNSYEVLSKNEFFTFDQGLWISDGSAEFDMVVVDNALTEYTETYTSNGNYESYKTVFFPSDILETSVNETLLTEETVRVFPTVVNGNMNISFPQNTIVQNVNLSVWDLNGKILLTQRYDLATQNLELNVSSLSSGLYFLHVQMPEGIRTIRFVKQ